MALRFPLLSFCSLLFGLIPGSSLAPAQTPPATPTAANPASDKQLTYEVISIKPDKENAGVRSFWRTMDDGFSASMTVENLLINAYDLRTPDQISGLPSWASSDQFKVDAKMDEETVAALKKLSNKEAEQRRNAMLLAALVDRLNLKTHVATKELPVYLLVVARGGPKLKETPAGTQGGFTVRAGELSGHGILMESLAYSVGGATGRIVIEKTGLTGRYDIELKWAADRAEGATNDTGPDIFTALQEQLGLKLESGKAPIESVIIEHIEKPSEN